MNHEDSHNSDELLKACTQGGLDLVRQLLDQGANIESANMHGQTCLILAANHGHIELVQLLLDRNADVLARDHGGNTALIDSFLPELSKLLVAAGSDVNVIGANGRNALAGAAMRGDLALVKDLIAAGAEIDPSDTSGRSALQNAADGSRLEVAEYLLAQGANSNYRDDNVGHTALIHAARQGSVEMVRLLMANEADIQAQDSQGNTALHNAAASAQLEATEVLLNAGAPLDARNTLGFTPLMVAASTRMVWKKEDLAEQSTQLLLGHSPDIHLADKWGYTALHHAAYDGFTSSCRRLLAAGADPEMKNDNGERPLEVAMKKAVFGYPDDRKKVRPETREADPNYHAVELLLDNITLDQKRYRQLRKLARESRCPEVLGLLTAVRPGT